MSQVISLPRLRQAVQSWIVSGRAVAGPQWVKPGLAMYRPLQSAELLLLEGFIHPANSIKEFVFPRHERLYGYRFEGKRIELEDAVLPATEQVLLGVRPCDAAALPILDRVFNWDSKDSLYNRRRELTSVVTLACRGHDAHCFCTSVGSGPADQRGSDAMLLDLGDGFFEVRSFTEKGTALFPGLTEPSGRVAEIPPGPDSGFDLDAVRTFLAGGYASPLWQAASRRCLGCGACAYTCPTCHCFDMVDEGTASGGARVRNWDACQFGLFTLHASGHNPRSEQSQRQRQRIYHKFQIYPDKFGQVLCTGCGNCTRNCPVGLGVRPVLDELGHDR
jgi:ferredoxin